MREHKRPETNQNVKYSVLCTYFSAMCVCVCVATKGNVCWQWLWMWCSASHEFTFSRSLSSSLSRRSSHNWNMEYFGGEINSFISMLLSNCLLCFVWWAWKEGCKCDKRFLILSFCWPRMLFLLLLFCFPSTFFEALIFIFIHSLPSMHIYFMTFHIFQRETTKTLVRTILSKIYPT